MNDMTAARPIANSLMAFGAVGVLATIVHFVVGLGIVGAGLMSPFNANILAFLTAFGVSYVGHRRFTYASTAPAARTLPRFFLVAVLGLGLNQVIVYLLVDVLGWSYLAALVVVVSLVPAVVYVIGRWAFRDEPQ